MAFKDTVARQITPYMGLFIEKCQSSSKSDYTNIVNLVYEVSGWSVVISEVKQLPWSLGKYQKDRAKATFDTGCNHWRLYYRESNKWVLYSDELIADFLDAMKRVEEDERGCFFG